MQVLYRRCAGLDLHKKKIVACRITVGSDGNPCPETRTFGTMTDQLLALSDWLTEGSVTHVAMESTGVYWKPVYNLLEGSFTLLLANAQHIKAVPGRKSDVKDAEWIADLLRHGLLKASFVPDRYQRELRELTRYRTAMVRERTAEVNRLHKTLDGANIQLAQVATNILGVSGRQILSGLVAGEADAAALAQLAKGKLREKLPELERALVGSFGKHQRFLVARQLAHIDELEAQIEELSGEITQRLEEVPEAGEGKEAPRPFARAVEDLVTIGGVGQRTAETLVAEIGIEMDRFPTVRHLCSWAGLVPELNETGGRRKGNKTRKGSPWLRSALVEAAHAAGRTKGTYLSAQYHRLAARRGKKKAAVAVAHTILGIVYYLLKDHTTYQDLGENYFEPRDPEAIKRRHVKALEALGYTVSLEALPAAA